MNRILARVPGLLTELSNKQAQVIRDLATRIGKQDEKIKYLESEVERMLENVGAESQNLVEQMKMKFAAMENRIGAQEREMIALRKKNEILQQYVDGIRETGAVEEVQEPVQVSTPPGDKVSDAHHHS